MARKAKQPPAALSDPVLTPTNPSWPSNRLVLCTVPATLSVRLKLTLSYAGFLMLAGVVLLVDLSLIAEEAMESLLPLAEKRGLTIETSGDTTTTVGSHALLLQLATNLVHNAIVHNLPEQGTVSVTTGDGPHCVLLTVENTGEKLTPDVVATLAEPFQRASERVRTDHAGVGLGLAIVKSITQAHEGILTLTPRDAGGLRVTVRLPATPHTGLAVKRGRRDTNPRLLAESYGSSVEHSGSHSQSLRG